MMITSTTGNLLEADAEALVNAVNCVGVMGKGIALQFKQAFPDNFRQYAAACRAGTVVLGTMFVVALHHTGRPQTIINFPTKHHWKDKSHLEDIQTGLGDLVRVIKEHNITSIAVPRLGCGNGGLDWAQVRPLIEGAFAELPDVQVVLYE